MSLEQGKLFGFTPEEIEAYALYMKEVRPLPGNLNMDQAIFAASLANGNKMMLKQLRSAQSVGDAGSVLKILEYAKDERFDPEDLDALRNAYETDDLIGFQISLRRLAGDHTAGTQEDAMKEYQGSLVEFDPMTRQYKPMKTSEEAHKGYTHPMYFVNCWRRTEARPWIITPSLVPIQSKPDHEDWHETRTICVNQMLKDAPDWEAQHRCNVVHTNIANALADLCQSQMNTKFSGFTGVVSDEWGEV
mmetsp:Transcript_157896/g.294535  ORF Transcript_157896/g.294535 Transcript_157896/m.294535 type:complete len:247 (+) Transcript_157896:54-794(+)